MIADFTAIKNRDKSKICLRSKKAADLLGFNVLSKCLSFQEEPPLPSGKTSLEQPH